MHHPPLSGARLKSKQPSLPTPAFSQVGRIPPATKNPAFVAPEVRCNSLFWNILPVSPCGSIFCKPSPAAASVKSFEINILTVLPSKNSYPSRHAELAANSRFWNILRPSPFLSIFCRDIPALFLFNFLSFNNLPRCDQNFIGRLTNSARLCNR